ncbi:hypothetical protein DUNSADRAFT_13557 [Dunaliella salina]|uniref:Uncharacterized protein n=1 Tax=Dunaliella salina TaxID=3046 RepID=A0ABQ7H344_DUNSA|nr:hypothetical protein DUNSADRAFT_13557 [Dunaliella salina]|eukprot:KAF5841284.1 hypothetical protein DUNSADRAFT_13557 [Dunaliella salina]
MPKRTSAPYALQAAGAAAVPTASAQPRPKHPDAAAEYEYSRLVSEFTKDLKQAGIESTQLQHVLKSMDDIWVESFSLNQESVAEDTGKCLGLLATMLGQPDDSNEMQVLAGSAGRCSLAALAGARWQVLAGRCSLAALAALTGARWQVLAGRYSLAALAALTGARWQVLAGMCSLAALAGACWQVLAGRCSLAGACWQRWQVLAGSAGRCSLAGTRWQRWNSSP